MGAKLNAAGASHTPKSHPQKRWQVNLSNGDSLLQCKTIALLSRTLPGPLHQLPSSWLFFQESWTVWDCMSFLRFSERALVMTPKSTPSKSSFMAAAHDPVPAASKQRLVQERCVVCLFLSATDCTGVGYEASGERNGRTYWQDSMSSGLRD